MLSISHGAMGNRSATNTVAVLWGVDHNNPDCSTSHSPGPGGLKNTKTAVL